ncbi:asparagine synthase-related protein [Kiritimatiella glycovorans]|uniref:asparagine synthase (glutamine-hydrolyzing) n=1 Tax=Kiritimatiella glycovorans TaxID=1307763 RepID=A0A0G3EEB3_9BACT|nr:asparagine synthase-related protein [Kiritimatiella glycovorans]AKJ63757.1 Asparagine synthetase B (glutamine-hydrolyzing) [Kiritimatiella glycovorans]
MSGFAVGCGEPDRESIEQMMGRIAHRGPFLYGVRESGAVMAGQNYLHADAPQARDGAEVPCHDDGGRFVTWDGQIGNLPALAEEEGVRPGAFREERLLLHLYEHHGADMFKFLNDAIFTCVVCDNGRMLAARDLLGIKTLFYGRRDGTLYLASELKALCAITDDVNEFPPGHCMDESGALKPFASLPEPPQPVREETEAIIAKVRDIIQRSFDAHVDFSAPTASLLSGGMDSSVIACLATDALRRREGPGARLKTYAIGVGESGDIHNARVVAEHLNTDHEELLVTLEQVIEALPDVIYNLESFDPSLVRSAVANFLISGKAREAGYEVLLSGEGGDEIFCGYAYLKDRPLSELTEQQIQCLGYLHSNASLRLDRMNLGHSMRVVAPLISGELLDYALTLPPDVKLHEEEDGTKVEKWIFRKAYEPDLPDVITKRLKAEFSQGSGSAGVMPQYFEDRYSDEEFAAAQKQYSFVRSKEEWYYFKLFREYFGDGKAAQTVGQWPKL